MRETSFGLPASRTPQGKTRASQNARKHGFTAARFEAGFFTTCLNESCDINGEALLPMNSELAGNIEITKARNSNLMLGDGFHRCSRPGPRPPAFFGDNKS
jgi:hypothetical protein